MKKIICAAGVYIAAVVGAGFASGQEAVSYFVRYGNISFIGVIIASVIFGIFAYAVSDGVRRYGATDFDGYIACILKPAVSDAFSVCVKIFMISVFFAMVSGGAVLLDESFGIEPRFGALLISVICGAVLISGNRRVLEVNSVLGIFLCISVVLVCFYILRYRETQTLAPYRGQWAVSAAAYAGYNILTAGAVLGDIRFERKRQCALFGAVSAIAMFAMMACMWVVLSIYSGKIYLGELPMLTLAMRAGKGITVFFTVVLFTAMITTALSAGMGALPAKRGVLAALLLCAAGYLMSAVSFSFIVGVIYRICGYAGNVFLILLIINQIKCDLVRKTEK